MRLTMDPEILGSNPRKLDSCYIKCHSAKIILQNNTTIVIQ